ncbi:MAG: SpoIIE family protein phosphatase [Bacteroidota bacterium]
MNSETIDKTVFLPLLIECFCKELSEEIMQFPIVQFPAEIHLGKKDERAAFFPIVVKGSIRLIRYDSNNNEILIHNVTRMQSCIMSITAAMGNFTVKGIGITNEETIIFAIPNKKSDEWMGKYKCWRKFVTELYEGRLTELIEQHDVIRRQKDEIFHQKKEITDSITYAQRIQKAVLPPDDYIQSLLPEHFVFFRPRDIVSGDYYWLAQIEHRTFVVVADCTGHGVPGAFMSMLGISLLNQMVNIHQKFNAGQILDELRNQVKKSLRQTVDNSESKDGMDLALMIFDFKNKQVEYAGALNPLYIIRDNCLIEKQPDRMPIGVYKYADNNFTGHIFPFKKGDMFYAFSDGFIDQFGGPKRKKFMSKQFKELLTNISTLPVSSQSEFLDKTLNDWKGDNEQTDDILVMGIRT